MNKTWLRIKLLYYLFRVSRDPSNTQAALAIGPCLFKLGHVQQTRKKVTSNSVNAEFVKSRLLLKKMDLHELKKSPPGSLAHTFAHHMLSNNLDPEFYGTFAITNDESYILMRLRQTHDLWHVLTGLSTSFQDELALQSFMLAQTGAPLATLLMGGALFRMGFTNDPQLQDAFDRIHYGWKMGKEAHSIFSLDWEANWNTPLDSLRSQYNIKIQTA